MCTVLQQKESVFDTDIFKPIIDSIQKYTWLSYIWNERRFRIVADHIRTATLLINDWVMSSNIWSWYVLRMIIRRMYYNLILLKDLLEQDLVWLISEVVEFTVNIREIKTNDVIKSLLDEINIFKNTISKWLKILQDKINSSWWLLLWKDIFFLYDTCWFPLELTKEICIEKNINMDEEWFQKELENQKERSRQSSKFQKDIDRSKYLDWIPPTEFIWYDMSLSSSSVSEGSNECKLLKDFEVNWQRVLIFDKTTFYAESGWQKGDSGIVELDTWEIVKIKDVQKYEWVFLHLLE
jgi:alanyl-tRNA synthetase